NGAPLAPRRIRSLLALEIESARRPTEGTTGDSSAHSRHEYCEPTMGCTADPRCTPYWVRNTHVSNERTNLQWCLRSAVARPRFPAPKGTATRAVPGQHRVER